jgi:hypothetical protein
MLRIFDYIFLRVYDYFSGKRDPVPETKGTVIVSLMQYCTVLDCLVVVRIIYPFPWPNTFYVFAILIPILVINAFHYENMDIQKVRLKWGNEEEKVRVRNGWIISLYVVASALIPIVYGSYK